MRILALVVAIMMIPTVSAVTWSDPADDHEIGKATHVSNDEPQMQWAPLAGTGRYHNVDVLEATIEETEDSLIFSVGVTSTETDSGNAGFIELLPEYWRYQYLWSFTYHGEELYAGFTDWAPFDFTMFTVFELQDRGDWILQLDRAWAMAEPRSDMEGWTAEIPKWQFRDGDMVPIREGDVLEDLTFTARDGDNWGTFSPCPNAEEPGNDPFGRECRWRVRDQIEGGQSLGDFEVKMSPPGVGHLFARIDQPVRQSNGLATTYVFETEIHNLDPQADSFYLQVSDVPSSWEVHLPPVVDFSGEGKETVPIAVTVPFQHNHGDSFFMGLTVVSEREPEISMDTWFAVVFADPPQPAGHHKELYFHTDQEGGWAWMNTLKKDPHGSKGTVDSYNWGFVDTGYRAQWDFGLNPGLAIGLDFDVGANVDWVFDLETPVDVAGEVEGTLLLHNWREDSTLTLATGTTDVSLQAETPTEIRLAMPVESQADRIPYKSGWDLYLLLNLTGEGLSSPDFISLGDRNAVAVFHTEGAQMDLPLFDYHDEVDLSGLSMSNFILEAPHGSYRAVNPGNTTVFMFNITNLADTQYTVEWELRGDENYRPWATFKPATTHLPASETGSLVMRVKAPETSSDGDVAEYLLIGRVKENEDLQVFARATAMVTTEFEVADESEFADELEDEATKVNDANKKESPSVALAFLLAGLVVLARRRR